MGRGRSKSRRAAKARSGPEYANVSAQNHLRAMKKVIRHPALARGAGDAGGNGAARSYTETRKEWRQKPPTPCLEWLRGLDLNQRPLGYESV
jgi:hypothetical protein